MKNLRDGLFDVIFLYIKNVSITITIRAKIIRIYMITDFLESPESPESSPRSLDSTEYFGSFLSI